ncbi:hypothetical protein J3R82DRAFT_2679 [Butyriboletus roseoflavus]|nr:hypothetical protein J3R82DRAFT_2679 [Butyriboletus roseoflavus]
MFAVLVTPILTLLAATCGRADPNPLTPGPGDVFIEGQACTTSWDVDTTSLWKTTQIDLMTGNNVAMVPLATVATVDGTDPSKTTFSYPCPMVSPHSAIYFYQFTSPSTENKTWTTRFAITDSVNDVVSPAQSTQPDGSKIPWGVGSLVNGSSAAPSASGASVATLAGAPSAPLIIPGSSSAPTTSTPTVDPPISYVVVTPSTVSTAEANGAVGMLFLSNILFQTAFALGLAAFGFTVMS